jgi:LysR family transcriptional regulator, hydrogen peroxide-inducible genes activator
LSRAIQKLEEKVGGSLFRREGNLTHLTDLGHLIRPHLERVFTEAEDARIAAELPLRIFARLGRPCRAQPACFVTPRLKP